MKNVVMIILQTKKDKSLIKLFIHFSKSKNIPNHILRKEFAASSLYRLLRNLERINQEVARRTGKYLVVTEKKQLGKHKFEKILRLQRTLEIIETRSMHVVEFNA